MTDPYYQDDHVTLWHGDCLDVLPTLPDASVESVVTDPPYELGFMGKGWDASGIAYNVTVWRECLRVLKPGGHLLAFGGSRTWHRLAVAIEDAGFELRDSIAWLYGSGFPKSLDVSKAIDKAAGATGTYGEPKSAAHAALLAKGTARRGEKHPGWDRPWMDDPEAVSNAQRQYAPATPDAERWQGWGTALKPAFEPVVVARKPLVGTVAANVPAWGTGALNIDGCRIGTDDTSRHNKAEMGYGGGNLPQDYSTGSTSGRWPANVILDEHAAAELDRQSGESSSRIGKPRGAASGDGWGMTATGAEYNDQGGASRFFYVAKAPTSERPRVGGIAHPTVKPLDLMRWLVRLVTPPGGTVLEPFAGSGTTAEACVLEGFQCIAIEREADYLPLITSRLDKPVQLGLDFGDPS